MIAARSATDNPAGDPRRVKIEFKSDLLGGSYAEYVSTAEARKLAHAIVVLADAADARADVREAFSGLRP